MPKISRDNGEIRKLLIEFADEIKMASERATERVR